MFPDEIVTPWLRLRVLSQAVVDPLDACDHLTVSRSDTIEEETKFVMWGPHETLKETLELLERAEEGHESAENTVYVIFPRDGEDGAGEFAGTAGFNPEWDKCRAVFGMWLRKEFWGRGYSGERAAAFSVAVSNVLDLDVALAYVTPEDEAPCRAIEKYTGRFGGGEDGLLPNETVDADDTPCDACGRSATREQWETATDDDYDIEFRWSLDPDDIHRAAPIRRRRLHRGSRRR